MSHYALDAAEPSDEEGQGRAPNPRSASNIPIPLDVLREFEDWLLDIVRLQGIAAIVGYASWHKTPIDYWADVQQLSYDWRDATPAIVQYRAALAALTQVGKPVPAYQALAIVNYVRTMSRYQATF